MIDVPLSAPQPVSQSGNDGASFTPILSQKRMSDQMLSDILDADLLEDEIGVEGMDVRMSVKGGEKQNVDVVTKWFCKKAKTFEVVSLSSDDEEEDVVISSTKHKGCDLVNLLEEEEEYIENVEYDDNVEEVDIGKPEYLDAIDEAEERYYLSEVPADFQNLVDVEEVEDKSKSKTIKCGDMFQTKKELQDSLAAYAMDNCVEMLVKRSDKTCYVVECKNRGCSFGFRASVRVGTSAFIVRRFATNHTCGMLFRHDHNRHATASVISQSILDRYILFLLKILISIQTVLCKVSKDYILVLV